MRQAETHGKHAENRLPFTDVHPGVDGPFTTISLDKGTRAGPNGDAGWPSCEKIRPERRNDREGALDDVYGSSMNWEPEGRISNASHFHVRTFSPAPIGVSPITGSHSR